MGSGIKSIDKQYCINIKRFSISSQPTGSATALSLQLRWPIRGLESCEQQVSVPTDSRRRSDHYCVTQEVLSASDHLALMSVFPIYTPSLNTEFTPHHHHHLHHITDLKHTLCLDNTPEEL